MSAATTETATLASRSLQLLPSTSSNVPGFGLVTTYYTTLSMTTGLPLFDTSDHGNIVSGELRPASLTSSVYTSGYIQTNSSALVDYGNFSVTIPGTDSDGDGTPDVVQFDKPGDFTAPGSGSSSGVGVTFSTSVRFTRAAGSGNGTYTATTTNIFGQVTTVTGPYVLTTYSGSITYSRGNSNTLSLMLSGIATGGGAGATLSGSTTYTAASPDLLTYAAFTARDQAGTSYSVNAGTLTRSGTFYRGIVNLADGLPATSWADFQDYNLTFRDLNDANGNGVPDLTDSLAGPPLITKQPTAVTVTVGQSATFISTATGALSFQWYKDDREIPGATSANLTISAAQVADAGSYYVVAANGTGSVASTHAILTVNLPLVAPRILTAPISLTVLSGGFVALAVEATGNPAPTFQWRRNGSLNGATNSTLVLTPLSAQPGSYTCTVTNSSGSVTSAPGVVTVAASNSAATADPGRLSNLSVRTVGGASGAETLIAGFNVSAGNVVCRGVGPSLAKYGVSDFLPDPVLGFYSGNVRLATNDNWGGPTLLATAFSQVGAFSYVSSDSKDSALLLSLAAGSYSLQLTSASATGQTLGSVLAEVYLVPPAESAAASGFSNLSARTAVGGSAGVLFGGFYVAGSTAKTLLIRAVGPGLTQYGVTGVLAQPHIEIYQGGTMLVSANAWGGNTDLSIAASRSGAFPLQPTSLDSAMMVTLPPGSYTAQVSGVGGTAGVALLEIYEVR